MHHKLNILLLLGLLLITSPRVFSNTGIPIVSSPDGKIKVEVFLQNDSLFYKAYHNNNMIVAASNIGIDFTGGTFLKDLNIENSAITSVDETYFLPSGKTDTYHNCYNELIVTCRSSIAILDVVFRAYNDGFAFRYASPSTFGSITVREENSFMNINNFESSWVQKYHSDYSWYYDKRNWNSNLTQSQSDNIGLNTPALVKSGNTYLLITEAANYGTYAASKLIANPTIGSYHFAPVGNISTQCPFEFPWRVAIVGDLKAIVESVMIENLNPPTESSDISWIKPGRVSWDWGGEDARNTVGWNIVKRYIDLAHEMGWEYFNLDDGWDSNRADYTLSDVVNYANERAVDVILWTHHNRFQNNRQDIFNKLKAWKDLGIKGLKVDFWEDDALRMMQKYDRLMDVTAELQMVVNLHGCTKPSGTRRQWPHLLTTEAVLGGEFYIQDDPYMVHARHNISLVMTRNVIGSMDYTPCDFARKNGKIQNTTSWSHQLALVTAYESGLQYFIDSPENYRYHIVESFLKYVPVAWNETKCLEAEMDRYVTLARRNASDWYVASLTNEARELNLDLSFLGDGTYNAYIYKDGDCMSEIAFDYRAGLTNQSTLTIPMLASGGATIHLSERSDFPKPLLLKYEAEDCFTYGSKPTDPDQLCSGGRYVGTLGRMNRLKFENVTVDKDAMYALTVYYMSNSEKSAYIKVNDEDTPLYYDFNNTGGETGQYLAFKTIVIPLKEGSNSIEIGNAQSNCPNIDRITIKSLVDDENSEMSYSPVSLKSRLTWTLHERDIVLNTDFNGEYTLFDTIGRVVQTGKLSTGENRITNDNSGMYIINVNAGSESFSFKINK